MQHTTDVRPASAARRRARRRVSPGRGGCGSGDERPTSATTTTADGGTAGDAAPVDAARHDHDRLPAHPQRRPRRQARGLARGGVRPTPTIEWKLFDSGGSVNEAVVAGGIDIGLAGSQPGLPRHLQRHRVPGAVDPRRHRRGRGAGRQGRHRHRIADLAGKNIATPFASTSHYSLLAALEDAGVDPSTSNIIDAEPDDIYAAWSHGRHRRRLRVEPEPGQDHRRRRQGPDHQRRPRRRRARPPTTSPSSPTPSPRSTRMRSRPGSSSRTGPSSSSRTDPDAAAEIIAAELNITPEEAPAQIGDLIFLTRRRAGRPGLPRRRPGREPLRRGRSSTRSSARSTTVQPRAPTRTPSTPTFAGGGR